MAHIPKGTDRNEELKRRLRMLESGETHELAERVLGQQHTGPFAATAAPKGRRTQTKERRGKRASALTTREQEALDRCAHTGSLWNWKDRGNAHSLGGGEYWQTG